MGSTKLMVVGDDFAIPHRNGVDGGVASVLFRKFAAFIATLLRQKSASLPLFVTHRDNSPFKKGDTGEFAFDFICRER